MELRVGNRYRLGRKIGSGSFGDIYLGEWNVLSSHCSVNSLTMLFANVTLQAPSTILKTFPTLNDSTFVSFVLISVHVGKQVVTFLNLCLAKLTLVSLWIDKTVYRSWNTFSDLGHCRHFRKCRCNTDIMWLENTERWNSHSTVGSHASL